MSSQVISNQMCSDQDRVKSVQYRSGQVRSGQGSDKSRKSCQVRAVTSHVSHVRSVQIRSGHIMLCHIM